MFTCAVLEHVHNRMLNEAYLCPFSQNVQLGRKGPFYLLSEVSTEATAKSKHLKVLLVFHNTSAFALVAELDSAA